MANKKKALDKFHAAKNPSTLIIKKRAEGGIKDVRDLYQDMCMRQPGCQINYDISYSSDVVNLHTHSFYEILFICRGQDVQYVLDKNRYRLQKGDIMLIPPGTPHRPLFLRDLSEPYERYALWIDAAFFHGLVPLFPELNFALEQCRKADSGLLRSTEASYSGLHAAFQTLWQTQSEEHFGWQAAVALGGIQLMLHVSRTFYYQDASVAKNESRNIVDEAFQYIDAHLEDKLTLESVSEYLYVSKSTVSHLFKQQLGVPFYHCVIQRRLILAKNLILRGDPLCEVWERCGFADYSSFYRLFKKEYGVSPQKFRNRAKEEGVDFCGQDR